MPEDKMLNNPYPNPHPKSHPNGYWFSSVSLFLFTHTLSNVYLSIHTPSVYLTTHIHTHSLYKYTLSLSLYTNSLNLSIHTPLSFSLHTPSLYLSIYSLYLSTHKHSLYNLNTLSFSFSLFLHTHFLYHYTVHSLSMSVHRPPDFLSLNILHLSQWRTKGVCRPGRILNLPPLEIFVWEPKIFLTIFFLASLSSAQLRLSCNHPKNFCSPSGLEILFTFQFFRYIPNFASPIAPLLRHCSFPLRTLPLFTDIISLHSLYLSTHTIPFSISLYTQSVFMERDTGTLCREIERVYVER